MSATHFDVIIVGAGFGGVYQSYMLRQLGYNVKVLEAGADLGGTWYWNTYPGARVDSDIPIYEFSMDDLWKDWNWTEKFPGQKELRKYFDYVDSKLDIKRHVQFNSRVVAAEFDNSTDCWNVKIENGHEFYSRYVIFCTGFASKPYIPPFKGLEKFKGIRHHTSRWPQEGLDLKGKRVGVVGTGSSGVQVIQECAAEVAHLTVFQRTPNLALPMNQGKLTENLQNQHKHEYRETYRSRLTTYAGFHFDLINQNGVDVPAEERNEQFEKLWSKGGFHFWLGSYHDLFSDQKMNDYAYEFWRDKVRARVNDPIRKEILAPTKAPHPFGTKRPSLEQSFYEVFNQSNVDLVNVSENPIIEITEKGILTSDGIEHELEILVLATGFDAVTGSIAQIDVKGTDGCLIGEKWGQRLKTYLGVTAAKYPNMFFLYGPHGPTAFCNGPTCVEIQAGWITNCLEYMRKNNLTHIEASQEAEDKWSRYVDDIFATQLFSKAKSWYTGANIPGKTVQTLNFTGGVPVYIKETTQVADKGYEGFILSRQPAGVVKA